MKYILSLAGTVLLLNGLFMLFFANLTLGVILAAVLGLALLLIGIFYNRLWELTRNGALKYIKITVIILLCAEVLLVGFVAVYGTVDNVSYTEDAVIVLGAGIRGDRVTLPLKYRLDKAIDYHKSNPEALIVVTGGQGFQETVSEAYAMEKYLLEHGISKDKIIKEEKATSTNENMRFSKQILDKHFKGGYSIAVVTNNFHIYRGVSIARLEGFENVTHIHAKLQWYNLIPCYIRESLAILKMWVFG